MKKRIVLALLICGAMSALRAEEAKDHFVQVTGEGEVKAEPNQAILNFGIETFGPKMKEVQSENARRTQELLEQLKKLKIAPADIKTDFVQISPRYDYDGGKRKFMEYNARKNFTVTLNDVSAYGKVLQAVLDAGVEYASGIQFQTSRLKSLQDEARKLAVQDARKKAETLAGPEGKKVGEVIFLQDNNSDAPSPVYLKAGLMRADSFRGAEDQVSPGQIIVKASITARFELNQ
jgi:uncharacterized protein YggE